MKRMLKNTLAMLMVLVLVLQDCSMGIAYAAEEIDKKVNPAAHIDLTVPERFQDGENWFQMPADGSKVTVTPVFDKDTGTTGKTSQFKDVAADAFYADAVAWAVANGITNGTGKGTTFSPDNTCTRAEAVTFLYRAAGSPDVAVSDTFKDVPANAYYAKAVAWAVANGITNGTGKGTTFSPNEKCSRAQIVTFLFRFEKAAAGTSTFRDVPANAYYAGAVGWAVEKGITNGTGDGTTFSPDADCTRGQIVTFLYRDFAK